MPRRSSFWDCLPQAFAVLRNAFSSMDVSAEGSTVAYAFTAMDMSTPSDNGFITAFFPPEEPEQLSQDNPWAVGTPRICSAAKVEEVLEASSESESPHPACFSRFVNEKWRRVRPAVPKRIHQGTKFAFTSTIEGHSSLIQKSEYIDEYLLTMSFIYLRRANVPTLDFTTKFLGALLLSIDMSEDDPGLREILFQDLLENDDMTSQERAQWRAAKLNDRIGLWRKMGYRAHITPSQCLAMRKLLGEHRLFRQRSCE